MQCNIISISIKVVVLYINKNIYRIERHGRLPRISLIKYRGRNDLREKKKRAKYLSYKRFQQDKLIKLWFNFDDQSDENSSKKFY